MTAPEPPTPTTRDIRETYYRYPGMRDWEAARAAAFDRWLTQHDQEVLEEARRAKEARRRPQCPSLHTRAVSGRQVQCTYREGHKGSHGRHGRLFWG